MADVIDCEACEGSGKVPLPTYRTSARGRLKTPEERAEEEKKAKDKEDTSTFLKRIFWACMTFPCLVAGVIMWANGCSAAAKEDAFNNNKQGILLVEYNGDQAVHCYVEREGTYYTGNVQKVVKLNNRHDDQEVQDLAKILNWDEATQGRCYRFKYDFDTK